MSRLTDALILKGLLTEEQLKDAQAKQLGAKKAIQELLVEMGFVKDEAITKILSEILKMPVVDLNKETKDETMVPLIPFEVLKRYNVFPVRKENDRLILAMSNPQDIIALDDIRARVNMEVAPVLASRKQISETIGKYYKADDMLYDMLKNVGDKKAPEAFCKKDKDRFNIDAFKGDAGPVPKLVNFMLGDALEMRASDIHIEPLENALRIRYRIDGDLRDITEIPLKLSNSIISRIKIMSDLNIAEKKKTQDGRSGLDYCDRKIDLRVSVVPSFHGEKIVIRLLDPKNAEKDVNNIGLLEDQLVIYKEACKKPQGMILSTGPTGSGKTSTLYATLNLINSEEKNIITIEDPIEYLIKGITQLQVNPVKDFTFVNGLRSILRQDPNVILVGEIRDRETADIAFRASLTGHLVFSTLHTISSIAAVPRLLDLGLEPYLIGTSLIMVVAQRLVKLICPHCKEQYTPPEEMLAKFSQYIEKHGIKKFYRGKGCPECDGTGYFGRTGIFELFMINEKIRDLIIQKAPDEKIHKEAVNSGFKLMIEAGMEKISKGLTTLDEVARVTEVSEEAEAAEEGVTGVEMAGTRAGGERIPKAVPVQVKAVKTRQKRILIVDDEEDVLQVLGLRLENEKYEVLKARNGKQAVEAAVSQKPDLIIMDIKMPEMDGITATKILRSKLETALIPIMMLTALKDPEMELNGLDAGADDYIGKPYESQRLLARIKMLLKRGE